MCRTEFIDFEVLPNPLSDPQGWFRVCDTNHDGTLGPDEVRSHICREKGTVCACPECEEYIYDVL